MHVFIYQFKLLLRNKSIVFWAFLFPLILATFFNLAFSQFTNSEMFEAAKLAVVEQKDNQELHTLLEGLSKDTDKQLLDVQFVSLKEAKNLLEDEKIDGYLIVDETLTIVVHDSGIPQTIIKNVVDSYLQINHSIYSIKQMNSQEFMSIINNNLNTNQNYFQSQNISSLDVTVIYFYTLIGMTCMYGGFLGLKISSLIEANITRQGTRINISPTSKWKMIISGIIVSFICQYMAGLVLLFYLNYGLNVSFGNKIEYILLLMAIGTYVGISIGYLIGSAFRFDEKIKTSILSATSLFLSFLSGMMIVDLKYIIQEYVPLLGYINPVNLITDALYALYYYPTFERFYLNIMILLVIGLILSMISVILSRRKVYDSL